MFFRKISVISCVLLGACASGGSGGVSGTAPPTPQPPVVTPPPPATLAAQPVGTTYTLAAHNGIEGFAVSTSTLSGVIGAQAIASPTGQVVKTTSGFGLTIPNGDQVFIDTSGASSQRIAPNLYFATLVPGSTAFMFRQGTALAYSDFGIWDEVNLRSFFHSETRVSLRGSNMGGVIAYGLKTEQMPVSGSATFTGSALGVYAIGLFGSGSFSSDSVKLVADFQTGRIAGSIANLAVLDVSVPSRLNDLYLSTGTISGASFTGSITAGANASDSSLDFAGTTGSFNGQFNGPNAAEAGGTFLLTNEQLALRLAGSFAATGQSTPAGQPVPTMPAAPTSVASAPAGTAFALFNRYGIESLDIRNAGTTAASATFAANPSATITIANDGFSLTFSDTTVSVFKNAARTTGPNGTALFASDIAASSRQGRFMAGTGLTYAAYGSWDQLGSPPTMGLPGTARNSVAAGVVAYGVRTTQMPTTGSATYTGGVTGLYFLSGDSGAITGGVSRLVADFSKGGATAPAVAGAITNITGQSAVTAGTRFLSDIFFTGSFANNASFVAQATGGANVAAADFSTALGMTSGAFYGPNAAELAGTFNLADPGLGISIIGAFGGTGQLTPSGQPAPTVPTPQVIDPNAPLTAVAAGVAFSGIRGAQLPVPVVSGPNTGISLAAVVQTTSGVAFKFGGDGAATLGAAAKGNFGYFGPITGANGATTGMIHLVDNPLTYSSYGTWTQSTATSPAAPPALEASTSQAAVFSYGNPTTLAQMPTTGTATYTGGIVGHFSTEPTGFGVITSGVLNLNADFARAAVSGGVVNVLALRPGAAPGMVDRLNDIALKQTFYNGVAGFYGNAAALPTPAATIDLGGPQGGYSGFFYGPGAPEIAGSLYLNDGHSYVQAAFAGRK